MNRGAKQMAVWAALLESLLFGGAAEAQPRSSGGTLEPSGALDGRLTADEVGRRAAETSYSAAAAREALLAAQARVDQAWTLYAPRITAVARYMRASDFVPPPIVPGPGTLVGTGSRVGTPNPPTVALPVLHFLNILDNYYLSANLVVPLSDYFLRILQGLDAAKWGEESARLDTIVARGRSSTDARVVFYEWLRARAGIEVAEQALVDQQTHLSDVTKLMEVERAAPVDVLRARTAVANAELGVTDARAAASILEREVRTAIHAPDDVRLIPGEDLASPPAAVNENIETLLAEAHDSRLELRALDASIAALTAQARVARAAQYPNLSLFANGVYANPNPRYLPPTDKWVATWDVGVQATWSPNDVPIGAAAGRDTDARARQLAATRGQLRDAIDVEVQRAYEDVVRGDRQITASSEELASGTEARRVARAGFVVGRVTSATLADVETELTRARFNLVNARANARIARIRLSFATGRETSGPHG